MRFPDSLSLRGRFLLAVLSGVVVPLAVVGLWLTASARRSGEELVRARLEESLTALVDAVGLGWPARYSTILDIADARAVQMVLREGTRLSDRRDESATAQLEAAWVAAVLVERAEIRDTAGNAVVSLPGDLGQESRRSVTPALGILSYTVPVRERFSGALLGKMEARLRVEGLLPPGTLALGVGGGILGLFDSRTGTALVPLTINPELLSRSQFSWRGERWLTATTEIGDPPLRFAVAGPVEPVTLPFEDATRRGLLALILTVAGVFGLATLFGERLTRSLADLSHAATELEEGDLTRRVEETGPPEVRGTARAFNSMAESLQSTLRKLSQREAVAAVGEFAASLAHEVRNPLTSIRLDLQRSQRKMGDLPGEARDLVERAIGEVDRLNASVDNVLRIARSGRVSLDPVDLRVPLEAAVRAAGPRFEAGGSALQYDGSDRPVWVWADEGAQEQLVLNLLLNAAEVLPEGGKASLHLERAERTLTVCVSDDGPGIPPEVQERVFEPFFTTRGEGTGLGLTVAQSIARAHGSELEVESDHVHGTTFRFSLRPVDDPPAPNVTESAERRNGTERANVRDQNPRAV